MRTCQECGVSFDPSHRRDLTEWCSICDFWLWHVAQANTSDSVRCRGSHYRLGIPLWADAAYKGMLGFGGYVFNIVFTDGRCVKTNNLWHQGTIPERFRDKLPDNASFEEKTGSYGS